MMKLSSKVHSRIKSLCDQGEHALDDEHWDVARKCYIDAFDLIPEPKERWEASVWVLSALGDLEWNNCNYERVEQLFEMATTCVGGLNPFVFLRLGQARLELGRREHAADALMRAYMLDGEAVFRDEDLKYLEFLRSVAKV